MTDPSTEAIPETPDAPSLLAHIELKVSEFETWAKNALAHATEHTHAAPLGRLLGTLTQTAKEIETLKSTGVMFALQQPLETWLENALGSAKKRADSLIEAFVAAVDAKLGSHSSQLLDDVRTLLTEHATQVQTTLDALASELAKRPPSTAPVPRSPEEPAPTLDELATLDAEPAFPSLADFVAQGFYADTYEHQKAVWTASRAGTATPEPAATEPPAGTLTTQTSVENGPSDTVTGASSGSA